MLVVPAEESQVTQSALPVLLETLGAGDDADQIRPHPAAAERFEQLADAPLRLVEADRCPNLLGVS